MAGELRGADSGPITAINVTPFVDVALVLLVIFMITAPTYLKDTLNIKLPNVSKGDGKKSELLGLAVTKSGQYLVNGNPMTSIQIENLVRETLSYSPNLTGIIAADVDARHGDVVKLIDMVKKAGLERFAVQIQVQSE